MYAVVVALSVASGAALVFMPVLAGLPIVALASAFLLTSGEARIAFVVFGGLFILQREEGLDASKMAFLGIFAVAFAGAFLNVQRAANTAAYRAARPLLTASAVFAGLAIVSAGVAYANAIPLGGFWLRDVAPYLLFASAPIFALDARFSLSERALVRLLVVAGTVSAVSFAVSWLDRRHIASLGAEYIGLATHFVPAALFAFGMSMALQARRSRWLILSAFVLALLLVTGTRTNLALLAAPLAIAFGARRYLVTRTVRLAVLAPVALALALAVGVAVVRASGANEELITNRINIFKQTASSSDASYVERVRQAQAAWDVFEADPLLGHGPGTTFQWQTYDGYPAESFLLDSPLTYPAKFGVVGLLVLTFVVLMYISFIRRVKSGVPGIALLALIGYLAVVLVSAFAYSPLQDKGFSFGLMLMLALVFAQVQETTTSPDSLRERRT